MSGTRDLSMSTIETARGRGGDAGDEAGEQLLVALECDRPLAGSSRHTLAGIDRVAIGRGRRRRAQRRGTTLELTIPDARLSERHAELLRVRDRWVLADLKSKNGTFLDGAQVGRTTIDDGDLVEAGHTLLLFRAGAPLVVPGVADLDAESGEVATFDAGVAAIFAALGRVAPTRVPILILGETGTGKEVAARFVHGATGRSGPFIAVNCGAIPATLVESELFGYRRGAFSGAIADRTGLVRAADGGTLFLDEIGDLPLPAQAAFLRVLQEGEVVPVGDSQPVAVDARVIAATNRDLPAMVADGRFRRDLHARLNGTTFDLPPLRDRLLDLGLLIAGLLRRHAGRTPVSLRPAAARRLYAHAWPDNVRELERCLESSAALAGRAPIDIEHLPAALRSQAGAIEALSAAEREHRVQLVDLLTEHEGNIAAVGRVLGKGRMQIHRWLQRYGIDVADFRR